MILKSDKAILRTIDKDSARIISKLKKYIYRIHIAT